MKLTELEMRLAVSIASKVHLLMIFYANFVPLHCNFPRSVVSIAVCLLRNPVSFKHA